MKTSKRPGAGASRSPSPSPALSLPRSLVRWQHAAGPYWPYVCAAPFVAELPLSERRPRRPTVPPPLTALLRRLDPAEPAAIFLDLPPTTILPAAPGLSALGFLVVPIIQRWPATPAVLPCRRLLAQLVGYASYLRHPTSIRGLAVLLDGERAGPPLPPSARQPPRRAFDNRYTYRVDRFPPPELLRHQGTETIRWLSPAGIAADLLPYTRQLAEAGFPIEVHATARGKIPSP